MYGSKLNVFVCKKLFIETVHNNVEHGYCNINYVLYLYLTIKDT